VVFHVALVGLPRRDEAAACFAKPFDVQQVMGLFKVPLAMAKRQ